MTTLGKLYGIGVGPGDPDLVTIKALKTLKKVDVIFEVLGKNSKKSVSGSILDAHELTAERHSLTFSMSNDKAIRHQAVCDNAKIVADALKQGKDCAFATIGDPMVYSTYQYLSCEVCKLLPDVKVETIPGVTSFQTAASKANFPLVENKEKLCLIPAFCEEEIETYPIDTSDTLVFLKTYKTRQKILDYLKNKGLDFECLYAAHLGLETELLCKDVEELAKLPEEYLSLLIVKKK